MRIVAGLHKGKALSRPPGNITRPMMDKVRESVFNMLIHKKWDEKRGNILKDAIVLDAFAGSGAIGLEALSRGAKFAYFFDKSPRALATVRENVWNLQEQNRSQLLKADATKPPKASKPMDIVFLDPPFGKHLAPNCLEPLLKAGWIGSDTLIVIEIATKEDLPLPNTFEILFNKAYGTAQVFFILLRP